MRWNKNENADLHMFFGGNFQNDFMRSKPTELCFSGLTNGWEIA